MTFQTNPTGPCSPVWRTACQADNGCVGLRRDPADPSRIEAGDTTLPPDAPVLRLSRDALRGLFTAIKEDR